MVYGDNTLLDTAGLFSIFFLTVFQIIVVRIRAHGKFSQQPAHTKLPVIFLDELILGYSTSLAKNAAAFFRKSFSFLSSAFCLRSRASSFTAIV